MPPERTQREGEIEMLLDVTAQTAGPSKIMPGLPSTAAPAIHPRIIAGLSTSLPQAAQIAQVGVTPSSDAQRRASRETAAQADAFYATGLAYQASGAFAQAQEAFERSIALREEFDDWHGLVDALNVLGSIFAQRSEFAWAMERYGRSLALSRSDEYQLGEADALNGKAVVYRMIGDPMAALETLHGCLPIYEQICEQGGGQMGDRANVARTMGNIASCHLALEQPAEAIWFGEQALAILEESGDALSVALGYNALGIACIKLGRIDSAISHFRNALTTGETLGHPYLLADTLSNLGDALMRGGRLERAAAAFARALSENGGTGQRVVYTETLARLGMLYARPDFAGRDDGAALRYLGKARRIGEEIGAQRELCAIYEALSTLHSDLYERAGASGDPHHLQEALALQRLLRETERHLIDEDTEGKVRGIQLRFAVERAHREAEFARCEAEIAKLRLAEIAAAASPQ